MSALPDMRMPRVMENIATHLVRRPSNSGRNLDQHPEQSVSAPSACRLELFAFELLPFSSVGRWPIAIRHCRRWLGAVKGSTVTTIHPRVFHSLLHFCNSFPLGSSSSPLFFVSFFWFSPKSFDFNLLCYANHFAVGIFSADMSGNEATSCTGPFLIAHPLGVFNFPFFFYYLKLGTSKRGRGYVRPWNRT